LSNHFQKLKKLTDQSSVFLCRGPSEFAVFHYICLDSLGWKKYWSDASPCSMLQSDPKKQQPSLPFRSNALYSARRSLINRDVLLLHEEKWYMNLPLVIRTIYLAYGTTLADAPIYKADIETLYYQISSEFVNRGIIEEVTTLVLSNELLQRLQTDKEKRAELRLTRLSSKPMTPIILFNHFVQIFKKYGIECMPFLPTHNKTAYYSTITNLKKLLAVFDNNKECLDFLTDCATRWGYLCTNLPKNLIFGHADISMIVGNLQAIQVLLDADDQPSKLLLEEEG